MSVIQIPCCCFASVLGADIERNVLIDISQMQSLLFQHFTRPWNLGEHTYCVRWEQEGSLLKQWATDVEKLDAEQPGSQTESRKNLDALQNVSTETPAAKIFMGSPPFLPLARAAEIYVRLQQRWQVGPHQKAAGRNAVWRETLHCVVLESW